MDPATMVIKADQRLDALARANRVRIARSELKREIADERRDFYFTVEVGALHRTSNLLAVLPKRSAE